MEFRLVRAVPEDAPVLSHIMDVVASGMENPEWFMKDDLEYITGHIGHIPLQKEDAGFIIKAVVASADKEEVAGFFMVAFPGNIEKNLGHHIGLSEAELLQVAHMDSVVILPEFRGHGLQYQLIKEAERVITNETGYHILMATVHPDNKYSLKNVLAHEYEVVAEALKYGGFRRYIVKKEI